MLVLDNPHTCPSLRIAIIPTPVSSGNSLTAQSSAFSKFLLCLVVFEISMNFNIFNIKNFAPKLQIYSLISSFILLILSYRFLVI